MGCVTFGKIPTIVLLFFITIYYFFHSNSFPTRFSGFIHLHLVLPGMRACVFYSLPFGFFNIMCAGHCESSFFSVDKFRFFHLSYSHRYALSFFWQAQTIEVYYFSQVKQLRLNRIDSSLTNFVYKHSCT